MVALGGFMGRSLKSVCLGTVCALAMATTVFAQAKDIDVPPGDLKGALDSFIRQSGAQLIYSADDVRGLKTGGARGALSTDQALQDLLRGTNLVVHRDSSGALVVVRGDRSKNAQAASNGAANALETVVVIADILKNRTLDADIRR